MKRFMALLLTVIMAFSLCVPAFAVEKKAVGGEVSEISGGHLFTWVAEDKTVVATTHDEEHLINISIKYKNSPDVVYQWTIANYPSAFRAEEDFWINVIDYAEKRMSEAEEIVFTETVYDKPIEVGQMRSSAGADLREDLRALVGAEYSKTRLATSQYKGLQFKVYEQMNYQVFKSGEKGWSKYITPATIVVEVLGLTVGAENKTVNIICEVLGVALGYAGTIAPSSIAIYTCRAQYCRYITVNDSEYIYNITYKFIEYKGYEDTNINSTGRARIVADTRDVYYSKNANYYLDYSLQIVDAYEEYLRIGQRP